MTVFNKLWTTFIAVLPATATPSLFNSDYDSQWSIAIGIALSILCVSVIILVLCMLPPIPPAPEVPVPNQNPDISSVFPENEAPLTFVTIKLLTINDYIKEYIDAKKNDVDSDKAFEGLKIISQDLDNFINNTIFNPPGPENSLFSPFEPEFYSLFSLGVLIVTTCLVLFMTRSYLILGYQKAFIILKKVSFQYARFTQRYL